MGISGIGGIGTDYSRYQIQQADAQKLPDENEEQAMQQMQAPPPAGKPEQAGGGQQAASGGQAGGQMPQAAAGGVQSTAATIESLTEDSDEDDEDQAIINKANSGSELTSSELSRLKDADPALYSSAVKAKQARDELRAQMQQNPSGAERAAQNAIIKNQDDSVSRQALEDEYLNFSAKYDQVSFSVNRNMY